MNDNEIREAARIFRGMTLEEVDRFAELLNEPVPMPYEEISNQIHKAEANLIEKHNMSPGLAEFGGNILRLGLNNTQDEDIMIDSIVAYRRAITKFMIAKLIIRTHPINGVRWFASLNTWREGDR